MNDNEERCPRCAGTKVEWDWTYRSWGNEPCRQCNGTGEVPSDKQTTGEGQ